MTCPFIMTTYLAMKRSVSAYDRGNIHQIMIHITKTHKDMGNDSPARVASSLGNRQTGEADENKINE
jgi:hypothetical protein